MLQRPNLYSGTYVEVVFNERIHYMQGTAKTLAYGVRFVLMEYETGQRGLTDWEIDSLTGILAQGLERTYFTTNERTSIMQVKGMYEVLNKIRHDID